MSIDWDSVIIGFGLGVFCGPWLHKALRWWLFR